MTTEGWDPMRELSDLLEPDHASKPLPDRRVAVPPPPTSDITEAIPRPPDATTMTHEPGTSAAVEEAAPRPSATPRRSSTRSQFGAQRREPAKQVTGHVPVAILDRVTRLRLDRAVEGRSFVISSELSAALLALPADPRRLAKLFDAAADELNVGRRAADEQWVEADRFSTRISAEADRYTAGLQRALHQEFAVTVDRQDLYGLALLQLLSYTE